MKPAMSNNRLQSTDFCLFLLSFFTNEKSSWGVRELALEVGKSPASIQRALNTLLNHGFVQKNEIGRYRLGLRCIHLGNIAQQHLKFDEQINHYLEPISETINYPIFFYKLQQQLVNCLYVSKQSSALQLTAKLGHSIALHLAPVAQIILAYKSDEFIDDYISKCFTEDQGSTFKEELKIYKEQGYAYSFEVLFKGTHSLSVPVFSLDGNVVGALSLASTTYESKESLLEKLPSLKQGATQIQGLFISSY